MPYSTTDPSRYPVYIDQIWQLAWKNREHSIPCEDKQQASKIRLQLNSYRVACRKSGHRLAPQYDSMEVIIRPTKASRDTESQPHTVTIRSLEDSELGQTLKASLRGTMFDLDNPGEPPTEEPLPDTSLPGEIKPGDSVF